MYTPLEEIAEAWQRRMRPGNQLSEDAISNADASADGGPQRHERVLIVTPTAGLDQSLYRVLTEAGLSCEVIADIDDLIGRVPQAPSALLVEQTALTPRVTEVLTALLRNQPTWSGLPVIVLAAPGAYRLPEGFHAYASLIVLEQPLRRQELVSMVCAAVTLRRRQADLGNIDISQCKQAEQRLQELNETLERRVQERTAEAEYRATQLRRLAAELTQAEERERRRLARVLHDHLQQLLVGMRLSLTSLQRQLPTEDLRRSAQQMDDLLNQSIATSRSLTAELSPPVLYEAGLAQALDWLAGWMRDKHGLIVDVQADASVNPQEKIRVLLFQVVRELLFNVVKHANTYQASVRMSRVGQQVQILVADAGVGFDPKRTRQRQRSVSGLGLFSIRERLEWLGGQMAVDSAPDRGTRVQILAPLQLASDERLDLLEEQPLAEVLQQAKAGPAREPAEQPGGRIRVLLADDHAVMRDGLAQLLQTQPDIDVVGQAADGQEAVDLTVQLQPDVVLMDVTMPRLGGVDATRRIKEQCAQAHVIGLSMHIEEDMATAMREAGACDYLTKSTDPEDLIATIHSCRQ